ncbi:lipopolysaccharide biosynthesis protein [Priestia megaterium]|uniref:lipopolysaccharide biosynthesis protein n=1 Tax=Priestia megaterium TaxID=1404 RepID=UPI00203F2894|nr:hypothetical protein [Priestia megaterium]MCM3018702.1 hypothetical protein [Priestia megaterium]
MKISEKGKHKSKVFSFLENFTFSFVSNLLSLLVSIITILIVPKFLGVTQYGYWQLYLLYISYAGVMQLGWCDGVYLRYGGAKYEDLNKRLISSQFWYISIFYILFSLLLFVFIFSLKEFLNVQMVSWALLSGFITTPRGILYYVLQATNRIKEFAKISIIDRVVFGISLVTLLLMGFKDYHIVIASDLVGKSFAFGLSVYYCKDMVFTKLSNVYQSIKEAKENLNAGFKLMVSNIASILIIGIVRFNIERNWGVEVFGKISLTLSVSNLIMIFINAIAIILFPMLRRVSNQQLPYIYKDIRTLLMVPIFFMLVIYYPLKELLVLWLPHYKEGIEYLALLFPLIVYESKMALLINTYLKSLRKEKVMLTINTFTVFLSLLTCFITVYLINSIDITILSIVALLAIRCVLAELYIAKVLDIHVIKDIIFELLLNTIFIIASWIIRGEIGLCSYIIVVIIYLFLKRKDITNTFSSVKSLVSK